MTAASVTHAKLVAMYIQRPYAVLHVYAMHAVLMLLICCEVLEGYTRCMLRKGLLFNLSRYPLMLEALSICPVLSCNIALPL